MVGKPGVVVGALGEGATSATPAAAAFFSSQTGSVPSTQV